MASWSRQRAAVFDCKEKFKIYLNKISIQLSAPKETILTKIEKDTYIKEGYSSSEISQPDVRSIVKFKAKQSFWKQEINQLLSEYRKMTYEANKILKTDELSEEVQQICKKLKLQENMLKMSNLMESKILIVEM